MASYSRVLVVVLAALVAACTTKKTETPAPTGPSEMGLSLDVQATPDILTQDGRSEAQVVVTAYGPNGQPLPNVDLRLDLAVNHEFVDFGRISAKSLKTGGDGRAVAIYRTPEPSGNIDRETRVQVYATPVGTNYNGQIRRFAEIRVVPQGTIGGETMVPDFEFEPSSPVQLETVTFDASDPELDRQIVRYDWNFGDGGRATGRAVSHVFREAGTYSVVLTVTDFAGRTGSRAKSVTVEASDLPTASFVFSPSEPVAGQDVWFNGSGSSATPPRQIVKYDWVFGDGKKGSGMVVKTSYANPGKYNVTLTVTDDAGNTHTANQEVEVQ
ncbi:MAG TPA: PKD domain-containing protein [Vicinamibacterales bacterium]